MRTYYEAWGIERGPCGHRHQTRQAAQQCAERDDRDVKLGHGPTAYSDRQAVAIHQDRRVA